jgi:ribA/ribD-fused uncharacterized protein
MSAQMECRKSDTPERICFYEQDYYVFSNFSAFRVQWLGIDFDTAEHAYHFMKLDSRPDIQQLIITARSAHDAFKLAEAARNDVRKDWKDHRVRWMKNLLRAKLAQHEYVRRKLIASGTRELVEDSWRDDFWGWGPNRDGQNMLGKLWMELRNELNEATQP